MGKYFENSQDLYDVVTKFLEAALTDTVVGAQFRRTGIIIQFVYTDPDAIVTINLKDPAPEGCYGTYELGDTDTQWDTQTTQSADFSNRFWQGKENPVTAIARRKMIAKGNVSAMMQIVPMVRPAFRLYKQILRDMGREDLIVK